MKPLLKPPKGSEKESFNLSSIVPLPAFKQTDTQVIHFLMAESAFVWR